MSTMVVVITVLASMLGAFLGAWLYEWSVARGKIKIEPRVFNSDPITHSSDPLVEWVEPVIKRKPRNADQIALEREKKEAEG